MSDWLISGWDSYSFVITPEEWEHCLAGFHCVIGNAHVPLDYHETPLEEYLDICHALYDRLMTGERLVWKQDYPLLCVQYLTTDLSRCGYGHIHEYQGERYKRPDFAEPCVSAALFHAISHDEQGREDQCQHPGFIWPVPGKRRRLAAVLSQEDLF